MRFDQSIVTVCLLQLLDHVNRILHLIVVPIHRNQSVRWYIPFPDDVENLFHFVLLLRYLEDVSTTNIHSLRRNDRKLTAKMASVMFDWLEEEKKWKWKMIDIISINNTRTSGRCDDYTRINSCCNMMSFDK